MTNYRTVSLQQLNALSLVHTGANCRYYSRQCGRGFTHARSNAITRVSEVTNGARRK